MLLMAVFRRKYSTFPEQTPLVVINRLERL